ncbi:hypothetical protein MMC10_000943 [Thelotrema lepadinum]|nr:hypothetical protein [Thelotrema lepadinum]
MGSLIPAFFALAVLPFTLANNLAIASSTTIFSSTTSSTISSSSSAASPAPTIGQPCRKDASFCEGVDFLLPCDGGTLTYVNCLTAFGNGPSDAPFGATCVSYAPSSASCSSYSTYPTPTPGQTCTSANTFCVGSTGIGSCDNGVINWGSCESVLGDPSGGSVTCASFREFTATCAFISATSSHVPRDVTTTATASPTATSTGTPSGSGSGSASGSGAGSVPGGPSGSPSGSGSGNGTLPSGSHTPSAPPGSSTGPSGPFSTGAADRVGIWAGTLMVGVAAAVAGGAIVL